MGLFDEMLRDGESIFRNEDALGFEFVPKALPYRGLQQQFIANCMKPLLQGRNGRNAIVHGGPGIGKTAAIKWILRNLEEDTDEVIPIYVNCWQKNTSYKVFVEICQEIGYKFVQNKKTEDLFRIIKDILNKKQVVFVFDEVDKLEDLDFIYSILNEIFKKSLILITNYKEWIDELDERIKSRLTPEIIFFKGYSEQETREILKQRSEYAFPPEVLEDEAVALIAKKAHEQKDIRSGLYLMREAGLLAEDSGSRKITKEHAQKAVAKLNEFTIKSSEDLEDDTKLVLNTVKENSGKKIGELFEEYKNKGGEKGYKTFQRKIEKLSENKFITTKKTSGGKEGNTTIVSFDKKLTDF